MSKKTKTTQKINQTNTNAPPSWTQPGLEQTAGAVTDAMGQIPSTHYSGQQVAYMSPEELAAIQGAWGTTAGLAGQYTDWMGQQLGTLTTPWDWSTDLSGLEAYDIGSMYDVQPVINASLTPVYRQLTEQILPGISSSALDAGAYTSDRAMGVMPMQAITAYSREASDIAAQIGYENYKDYEARRLAAWEAWNDDQLGAYGAETQRGIGQQSINTDMLGASSDYITAMLRNSASVGDLLNMSASLGVNNQQASINDLLAQDKYASYAPFMGLDQATQLLTQLSGGWGTQNIDGVTTTKTKTSDPMEWVKTAIAVGSMAMGMPPIGMGGGSGSNIAYGPPPSSFVPASSLFPVGSGG